MTVRAIIAEDESVLREQMLKMLAQVWPELDIVAVAEDGVKAAQAIEQRSPDVLFLDIEMPGMSGLDVARLASGRCHVVFVTAYDQHAVAAFDQGAVDYVMKPVTVARLYTTCNRVRQRLASTPANLELLLKTLSDNKTNAKPCLRWINASTGTEVRILTTEEICYFQSDTKYTRAVTATSDSLVRMPLKDLVDQLDPTVFWQIHRSTIVNINAVGSVVRDVGGRVLLKLKARREMLQVSEAHAHLFRQM
jgi:Response regulator of the LytR/AlgR family